MDTSIESDSYPSRDGALAGVADGRNPDYQADTGSRGRCFGNPTANLSSNPFFGARAMTEGEKDASHMEVNDRRRFRGRPMQLGRAAWHHLGAFLSFQDIRKVGTARLVRATLPRLIAWLPRSTHEGRDARGRLPVHVAAAGQASAEMLATLHWARQSPHRPGGVSAIRETGGRGNHTKIHKC